MGAHDFQGAVPCYLQPELSSTTARPSHPVHVFWGLICSNTRLSVLHGLFLGLSNKHPSRVEKVFIPKTHRWRQHRVDFLSPGMLGDPQDRQEPREHLEPRLFPL